MLKIIPQKISLAKTKINLWSLSLNHQAAMIITIIIVSAVILNNTVYCMEGNLHIMAKINDCLQMGDLPRASQHISMLPNTPMNAAYIHDIRNLISDLQSGQIEYTPEKGYTAKGNAGNIPSWTDTLREDLAPWRDRLAVFVIISASAYWLLRNWDSLRDFFLETFLATDFDTLRSETASRILEVDPSAVQNYMLSVNRHGGLGNLH